MTVIPPFHTLGVGHQLLLIEGGIATDENTVKSGAPVLLSGIAGHVEKHRRAKIPGAGVIQCG